MRQQSISLRSRHCPPVSEAFSIGLPCGKAPPHRLRESECPAKAPKGQGLGLPLPTLCPLLPAHWLGVPSFPHLLGRLEGPSPRCPEADYERPKLLGEIFSPELIFTRDLASVSYLIPTSCPTLCSFLTCCEEGGWC